MSELRMACSGTPLLLSPEHPRGLEPAAPLREDPACPLCPGGAAHESPELGRVGDCFATPMGRPALRVEEDAALVHRGDAVIGAGLGAHELLMTGLAHGEGPERMGPRGWARLLALARARVHDLRGDRRLGPIALSVGWRRECGAQVDHLHAQLHALPVALADPLADRSPAARAPARLREALEVRASGRARVVCPGVPLSPFELLVQPSVPSAALESADDALLIDIAENLHAAIVALTRALGPRPLALGLLASPGLPWALRVSPWVRHTTAVERITGLVCHDVPPEVAATWLREALRRQP